MAGPGHLRAPKRCRQTKTLVFAHRRRVGGILRDVRGAATNCLPWWATRPPTWPSISVLDEHRSGPWIPAREFPNAAAHVRRGRRNTRPRPPHAQEVPLGRWRRRPAPLRAHHPARHGTRHASGPGCLGGRKQPGAPGFGRGPGAHQVLVGEPESAKCTRSKPGLMLQGQRRPGRSAHRPGAVDGGEPMARRRSRADRLTRERRRPRRLYHRVDSTFLDDYLLFVRCDQFARDSPQGSQAAHVAHGGNRPSQEPWWPAAGEFVLPHPCPPGLREPVGPSPPKP